VTSWLRAERTAAPCRLPPAYVAKASENAACCRCERQHALLLSWYDYFSFVASIAAFVPKPTVTGNDT
jgi:hypothetical protein